MKFKKIYIEITNNCNLNCSFCSKDNRIKRNMTLNEFELIMKKIEKYTNVIYLHVKGEPLLHPNIKEILDVASKYNININLTTNGVLLKNKINEIKNAYNLKKINISLHSENNKENYFEDIFESSDELSKSKTIIYRMWTLNNLKLDKKSTDIVEKIKQHYNLSTEIVEKLYYEKNIKINNNIYVDKDSEFSWPSLNQEEASYGFCHALKTHIAILSNGDVVPCCLDSNGIIKLGNIFEEDLLEIIKSERYRNLKKSFQDRKPCEKLCQKCTYKSRKY